MRFDSLSYTRLDTDYSFHQLDDRFAVIMVRQTSAAPLFKIYDMSAPAYSSRMRFGSKNQVTYLGCQEMPVITADNINDVCHRSVGPWDRSLRQWFFDKKLMDMILE